MFNVHNVRSGIEEQEQEEKKFRWERAKSKYKQWTSPS